MYPLLTNNCNRTYNSRSYRHFCQHHLRTHDPLHSFLLWIKLTIPPHIRNKKTRRCVIMSKLLRCSSISDLVMYFSTLPSSSISAPCILLTLTQLKRVCRNFSTHPQFIAFSFLNIHLSDFRELVPSYRIQICIFSASRNIEDALLINVVKRPTPSWS